MTRRRDRPSASWRLPIWLAVALLLAACGEAVDLPIPTVTPASTPSPTATSLATVTAPDESPTISSAPSPLSLRATIPASSPTRTAAPSPTGETSNVTATTTPRAPGPGPAATEIVRAPDLTATPVSVPPTAIPTETPIPQPTATPVLCPGAIAWHEAVNHIGEYLTVIGPVVGATWAQEARGKPTFLNLGRPYPDPGRFTILIWIDGRWNFPAPPEETYLGRTICVTGTIELYEGSPEMVVEGPEWISAP